VSELLEQSDFLLRLIAPLHTTTNSQTTGGNHDMAQDAGAMQFLAGWDWVQGIPDRATGIFDVAWVDSHGAGTLANGRVVWNADSNSVDVEVDVDVENDVAAKIEFELVDPTTDVVVAKHISDDINNPMKSIALNVDDPKLWWPHTLGEPFLYEARISLVDDADVVLDSELFKVGLRTIEAFVHPVSLGQAFSVNGVDLFLMGGNWIATDAMLQKGSSQVRRMETVRSEATRVTLSVYQSLSDAYR